MNQRASGMARVGRVLLWVVTALPALGIGLSGTAKFFSPSWHQLFVGWGYPMWFCYVIGVAEVGGAIALIVPRTAAYGAILLAAVMTGAVVTLQLHPGGNFGRGGTPAVYVVLLAVVGVKRWQERAVGAQQSASV